MLTPSEIAAEIDRFNVNATMFTISAYKPGIADRWHCQLTYVSENESKIETKGKGATIDDAMSIAWTALSDTARFGFRMPEVLQIAAPKEEAVEHEELPF